MKGNAQQMIMTRDNRHCSANKCKKSWRRRTNGLFNRNRKQIKSTSVQSVKHDWYQREYSWCTFSYDETVEVYSHCVTGESDSQSFSVTMRLPRDASNLVVLATRLESLLGSLFRSVRIESRERDQECLILFSFYRHESHTLGLLDVIQ